VALAPTYFRHCAIPLRILLSSFPFFFFSALSLFLFFFFFNDTPTTEIYTLSLHDALPILSDTYSADRRKLITEKASLELRPGSRSEEHTSELQSLTNLVCRLLLEKKKKNTKTKHKNKKQTHKPCRTYTSKAHPHSPRAS